jgi:hypothetical protein
MILSNLATGLKQRDWGTVAVEVLIVVVGIFIGLQVDDWNQARIDRADIAEYMERVQGDLNRDTDFFAFLANKASAKREALATLKKIIARNRPSDEDPESIFGLLSDSVPMGFEFPEVQTVTFLDLRSSGKLTRIEDAELRRQLSFYYQESVHRSDRVESRITGYAAAVYQMLDPRTRLVGRDSELHYEPPDGDNEDFDLQAAAADFLIAAREDRFSNLLTAEQNYTEFLTAQVNIQREEIRALQQAVSNAGGEENR